MANQSIQEDSYDEDSLPASPWWIRVLRGLIAVVALAGVIYLSGIHQYFFFHRTPPTAQQPVLASKVTAEELTVPVIIHVLSGDTGSERTQADAERLIENANRIWAQANIRFVMETVAHLPTTTEDLYAFNQEPHTFIEASNSYDPSVANLYLTRTLAGVNGLAYGGTSAVAVADYTSTLDYRTLAHEFGHLLGLPHVTDHRQLMSSGATGVELSEDEIATARATASSSFK